MLLERDAGRAQMQALKTLAPRRRRRARPTPLRTAAARGLRRLADRVEPHGGRTAWTH